MPYHGAATPSRRHRVIPATIVSAMSFPAPTPDALAPILAAWGVFVLSTCTPGPAILATVAVSARSGRRAGIAFALGVCAGSAIWGLATTLGLAAAIAAEPRLLDALRVAGAVLLAWLALRALASAIGPGPAFAAGEAFRGRPREVRAEAVRGLLVHLANPKAPLAWIAVVAIGTPPGSPAWAPLAVLAGAAAFALSFYPLLATLAASEGSAKAYLRLRRPLESLVAAILAAAAVRLVLP